MVADSIIQEATATEMECGVNKMLASSVTGFIPMSDRIAILRLKLDETTLNVIQVYAPTADPKYDN